MAGSFSPNESYASLPPRGISTSSNEWDSCPICLPPLKGAAAGTGDISQVDDIAHSRRIQPLQQETVNRTDQHPEKPFRFARSAVRDGRLPSRTRFFSAASMSPSLQRPPHRGAGAEPRRALSPVSLASEKPGRRRQRDDNVSRNDTGFSPPGRGCARRKEPLRPSVRTGAPPLSGEADRAAGTGKESSFIAAGLPSRIPIMCRQAQFMTEGQFKCAAQFTTPKASIHPMYPRTRSASRPI